MKTKDISFSFIIPVYNRPNEIRELLESLSHQTYAKPFEIVIVEDGSQQTSEDIVELYKEQLNVQYLFKPNSGPGDSRNYGMRHAKGNYFLILDSDCILPQDYLQSAADGLRENYVDCFGGPDAGHESFSILQRAINYSMTSFWTTGGIRGGRRSVTKFEPRSFNMGISKEAFESSGGFGNIHPGEDPDLSLRLKKLGFSMRLIPEAKVFHKRRINLSSFLKQVKKFGMVRPILLKWHPKSYSITYWFPTLFSLGLIISSILFFYPIKLPLYLFGIYFLIIFLDSLRRTANLGIALLSIITVLIQFFGYGYGFLKSIILVNFSKKNPRQLFPELFFQPTAV